MDLLTLILPLERSYPDLCGLMCGAREWQKLHLSMWSSEILEILQRQDQGTRLVPLQLYSSAILPQQALLWVSVRPATQGSVVAAAQLCEWLEASCNSSMVLQWVQNHHSSKLLRPAAAGMISPLSYICRYLELSTKVLSKNLFLQKSSCDSIEGPPHNSLG